MEFNKLTGATKLDEFEAKDAYFAICDIKGYLNYLVRKTHNCALCPDDLANAFKQVEDAYDATSDPHLTPALAKQIIDNFNEVRQNKAFAMNKNQLDFDLTCIKAAL